MKTLVILFLITNLMNLVAQNDGLEEGNWEFSRMEVKRESAGISDVSTYDVYLNDFIKEQAYSSFRFSKDTCFITIEDNILKSPYQINEQQLILSYFTPYVIYDWKIDDNRLWLKHTYSKSEEGNEVRYMVNLSYKKTNP